MESIKHGCQLHLLRAFFSRGRMKRRTKQADVLPQFLETVRSPLLNLVRPWIKARYWSILFSIVSLLHLPYISPKHNNSIQNPNFIFERIHEWIIVHTEVIFGSLYHIPSREQKLIISFTNLQLIRQDKLSKTDIISKFLLYTPVYIFLNWQFYIHISRSSPIGLWEKWCVE